MHINCLLAALCLAVVGPAYGDEPVVPVGCGRVLNLTECAGCEHASGVCQCVPGGGTGGSACQTNQNTCDVAHRAFQACDESPPCYDVYKQKTWCHFRYQCNNDSGVDGGACGVGVGGCMLSEEMVTGGYWG